MSRSKYELGKEVSLRDVYGDYLVELGKKYPNIIVIDADLSSSTKANKFGKEFKQRYLNVGISETLMQLMASGIASEDYKVYTNTFAIFAVKGAEKILQAIARDKRDVKIIGTHGGISVGEDGDSHQGINDIAVMRSIPGLYVFCPADAVELESMLDFTAEDKTPTYIRISRNKLPVIHNPEYKFQPGRASVFEIKPAQKKGKTVTIISYGDTVHSSLDAAKSLAKYDEINPVVVNMSSIEPIDKEVLREAKEKSKIIITVEDHVWSGGLGEAVGRVMLEDDVKNPDLKFKTIALMGFAESGSWKDLYKKYGLDKDHITRCIIEMVK